MKDKLIKTQIRGIPFYTTKSQLSQVDYNNFESFSLDLLLKYLKPNSVFLDIGAHFGFYSTIIASKIKKIKVIAFEPVKNNFEVLKKNIKLNKIKNSKLFNLAASDKKAFIQFNEAEVSSRSSFYTPLFSKTSKIINVKTVPLDEIIKERVDFIKIDVEGHEIPVLSGLNKIIKSNPEIKLLIEFNPKNQIDAGYNPNELLKKLESLRFEIFAIFDYPWQEASFKEKKLIFKPTKKICKLTKQIKNWNGIINPDYHVNLLCVPKNKSLFVSFFSHSSQLGGSERSLLELIDELLEENVLINVILPEDGPLKKLLDERPVMTKIIPYTWWAKIKKYSSEDIIKQNTQSFLALIKNLPSLKEINPDGIYTNTITIPWGSITAFILGKPHIWHIREYGKIDHNLYFDLGEVETKKFINATSDAVITNSNAIRDFYKDYIDEKKITTVYNYISIPKDRLSQKPEISVFNSKTSKKLLVMGTIIPSKGQFDAVLAVHELVKKKYNVELALIGSTGNQDYKLKIEDYILKNKLHKNIHIHGFVNNPYPIINNSDIVLTCSINEAFGRITVEAMLLKKPVIATKSGGTIELIREYHTGLFYNPGDYIQLANKIKLLINNNELKEKISLNGYKFIKKIITKRGYGKKIYALIKKNTKNKSFFLSLRALNYPLIMSIKKLSYYDKPFPDHDKELELTKNMAITYKNELDKIKSSKTYKIWQGYCEIMKRLGLKK